MKTPSAEIRITAVMVGAFPIFQLIQIMLLTEEKSPTGLYRWGVWFLVCGILGYGVFRLNEKMRLAAVMIFVGAVIAPLIGIIIAPFLILDKFLEALEMYGAYTVLWKPLMTFLVAFLPSMAYSALIVHILTRPRVKLQFREEKT